MQQIYGNVTKVLIESRQGSNLLYLPLDKIMQQAAQGGAAAVETPVVPPPSTTSPPGAATDSRARDNARGRERESR
jgi:membrane protease subunit HflK